MTDLPKPIKTRQGETIEMTVSDLGIYTVECWDAQDESRWHRMFHDRDKADAEFARWEYLRAE